jgi:hypothetical protein
MLKDYLRESKAFRSLRQGIALSRAGFLVPTTIVAGEERSYRFLKRAFVLTLAIPGEPMPVFLQNRHLVRNANWSPARKRSALENLAREIQRLHELGFIHGDLVPSNIMVTERPGGELEFYLMDNDRTRRYPPWFPQTLWKRNLVQLNRFPLPGISLQDRMRFFRSYAGRPDWNRVDWRLLGWLERKTRARRKECDAVDDTVSFRRLMRWDRELVDPNPSLSRERRGIFSSRRER